MPIQIQYRRGPAADWTTFDPTLALGEPGYETDTGRFKVGDGTSLWSALPYSSGPAGIEVDSTAPTNTSILWADTGDPGNMVLPLGGATHEILAKLSASDYDTAWINPGESTNTVISARMFFI